MDPYTRLIVAGIRPACAATVIEEFNRRNDPEGLERYITDIECRMEASER